MSDAFAVPGVYITESNGLALSIQSGETAVPVFIGVFNPVTPPGGEGPHCVRIESWLDFTRKFYSSDHMNPLSNTKEAGHLTIYHGSYSVRLYFENGGGPCYVLFCNDRQGFHDTKNQNLIGPTLALYPDITLLCWCEVINPKVDGQIYAVLNGLLGASPTSGGNRGTFLLADAWVTKTGDDNTEPSSWEFSSPAVTQTSQVATYFPGLITRYTRDYYEVLVSGFSEDEYNLLKTGGAFTNFTPDPNNSFTDEAKKARARFSEIKAAVEKILPGLTEKAGKTNSNTVTAGSKLKPEETSGNSTPKDTSGTKNTVADESKKTPTKDEQDYATITKLHESLKNAEENFISTENNANAKVYAHASVAMAGVYARVDRERGVWKAPANVQLNGVTGLIAVAAPDTSDTTTPKQRDWGTPMPVKVDDAMNDKLMTKNINAIREFTGRGTLVWGARTMEKPAKKDWLYVPVRRLFNAVERDVRVALRQAMFEPNSPATWESVRSALVSYLHDLWRKGALQGDTPEQAYQVQIGLGVTMTSEDINDGQLKVKVALAAVRPAEFIVLELSQQIVPG